MDMEIGNGLMTHPGGQMNTMMGQKERPKPRLYGEQATINGMIGGQEMIWKELFAKHKVCQPVFY